MASIAGILGANVFNSGLANAISGSQSNSGGTTSSYSTGGSTNSAQSINSSNSNSWSNTAGNAASALSALQAQNANSAQRELMKEAMEFNAKEAQKQRDWQTEMANTVYTRSVKNMIEAGINPILAASAGLSAASVGSGMSANISAPSAFMGQTFAEQNSASQSNSYGQSSQFGSSYNESQSHGNEWSNSQSGLATGLKQMATIAESAIDQINSSEALKYAMENFGDGRNRTDNAFNESKKELENVVDKFKTHFSGYKGEGGGGHGF